MFGSLTRLGAWLFVVVWVLGSVEAWWFCWRPKPWKNDVLNVTPATILLWSLRQFNVWLEFTWSNCCCEAFLYLQFIHCNAGNTRSLEKELGKFFEYRHPGEWLNQILIDIGFVGSHFAACILWFWLAEAQVVLKRQSQKPRSWVFTCQHQILSSQRTWSRKKWRNPIQRYLNVYREVRWQAISFIVKMISFWA